MRAAIRLLDHSNFKYPILCQALPLFRPSLSSQLSRKHTRSDSAPCQKFVYGASLWERVGEWLVWRYVERSQTVPCSYYLAAHMRISWNVLIISGTGRRWFWETVSSQFLYEGRLSNSAVASCNPSFIVRTGNIAFGYQKQHGICVPFFRVLLCKEFVQMLCSFKGFFGCWFDYVAQICCVTARRTQLQQICCTTTPKEPKFCKFVRWHHPQNAHTANYNMYIYAPLLCTYIQRRPWWVRVL